MMMRIIVRGIWTSLVGLVSRRPVSVLGIMAISVSMVSWRSAHFHVNLFEKEPLQVKGTLTKVTVNFGTNRNKRFQILTKRKNLISSRIDWKKTATILSDLDSIMTREQDC